MWERLQEMALTDSEKLLIMDSFAKVAPISDQVAASFYEKLFEVAPDTKALFAKIDMQEQGRKLMQTIATAVGALYTPDVFDETFEALGKRHIAYGVTAKQYQDVQIALIHAFEQNLGDDFTADVKRAWENVYEMMADTAKKSYGR